MTTNAVAISNDIKGILHCAVFTDFGNGITHCIIHA